MPTLRRLLTSVFSLGLAATGLAGAAELKLGLNTSAGLGLSLIHI